MDHELTELYVELPDFPPPLPPAPPDLPPHPVDASRTCPTDRPDLPRRTPRHELEALFDNQPAAPSPQPPVDAPPLPRRLFSTPTHDAEDPATHPDPNPSPLAAPAPPRAPRDWRLQRYKAHRTVQGVLVACHNEPNLGIPPPDAIHVPGRAEQLCWLDPPPAEGDKRKQEERWAEFSKGVAERLHAQFTRLNGARDPRFSRGFSVLTDPCVQELRDACLRARRDAAAAAQRVLFYYNGRGVPRPTATNEIWLFSKHHTQYVPLSLHDLQAWLGAPAVYIFDCPAAARVLPALRPFHDPPVDPPSTDPHAPVHAPPHAPRASPPAAPNPLEEAIVFMACQADEGLPTDPALPADAFTAALTTPLKLALRVHARRTPHRLPPSIDALLDEMLSSHPPRYDTSKRENPLGELNWVFNTITEAIAWNSLPRDLFHRLFRGDLVVAALARNFLLAERLLTREGVRPTTYPLLPPTAAHPLWGEWDRVLDHFLRQVPEVVCGPDWQLDWQQRWAPCDHFFRHLDELRAHLDRPDPAMHLRPPPQLPILLQVFLSTRHRLDALVLFARLLDLGPWAVDLGLAFGAHMYMLKLIMSAASPEAQVALAHIWAKLVAVDPSLPRELVDRSEKALHALHAPHHPAQPPRGPPLIPPTTFFVHVLQQPALSPNHRSLAAYILARLCQGSRRGQDLCMLAGGQDDGEGEAAASLMGTLLQLLRQAALAGAEEREGQGAWLLRVKCVCLAVAALVEDRPEHVVQFTHQGGLDVLLEAYLPRPHPEVRAAAVHAVGSVICSLCPGTPAAFAVQESLEDFCHEHGWPHSYYQEVELQCIQRLLPVVKDASVAVRCELAVALARLASGHMPELLDAVGARLAGVAVEAPGGWVELAEEQGDWGEEGGHDVVGAGVEGGAGEEEEGQQDCASLGDGGGGAYGAGQDEGREVPGGEGTNDDGPQHPEGPLPLYQAALDVLLQLANDPAPRVARIARQSLVLCGCTLLPSAPCATPSPSHPSPATRPPQTLHYTPPPGHHSLLFPPTPHPPYPPPNPATLSRRPGPFPTSPHATALTNAIASPLLRPHTTTFRDTTNPPWTPPCSPAHAQQRRQITCTATTRPSGTIQQPRLKHAHTIPLTLPVAPTPPTSLAFHPIDPLLTTADASGLLHTHTYPTAPTPHPTLTPLTTFHSLTGACHPSPLFETPIVDLYPLNTPYSPSPYSTLMTCAADGIVRVWHTYPSSPLHPTPSNPTPTSHRLATAWQAVPPSTHPTPARRPTVFALAPDHPLLFAAGGALPSTVHVWDLAQERCTLTLTPHDPLSHPLPPPTASSHRTPPNPSTPCVTYLSSHSTHPPLLLTATSDNTLRIFDIRVPLKPIFHHPHPPSDPLLAALLAPCSLPLSVLVGTRQGTLQMLDLRAPPPACPAITLSPPSPPDAPVPTPHISHLAAHPYVPLVATAATDGIVKIWNPQTPGHAPQRYKFWQTPSPITALAFHPHQPLLAAATAQPSLTICEFDDGAPRTSATARSAAA